MNSQGKILIIGANGQLGFDCRTLFAEDNDVVALDLPDIDITSVASVQSVIDAVRPTVVVNCAAYTAVDKAESEEALAYKINAEGPGNIAAALQGTSTPFIHISTDYVFDGKKPLFTAYTEDDTPSPLSAYGRTKLEGEKKVLAYSNGAVLRTAWLYGINGKNFLKTMHALAQKPNPIRVVADQYGSPTSSASLARQIKALVEKFTPGLYHATSQGYCSWYELTKYFFEVASIDHEVIPITTAEYPTPAHRPANSILENRNLKALSLDVMPDWHDEVAIYAEARLRLAKLKVES